VYASDFKHLLEVVCGAISPMYRIAVYRVQTSSIKALPPSSLPIAMMRVTLCGVRKVLRGLALRRHQPGCSRVLLIED
jgi:hypothetical protein